MKAIVLYYSLTARTQLVAEQMAKELQCQVYCIKLKKEYKPGPGAYLRGGYATVAGKQPELAEPLPDLADYSHVLIGFPVWAGKPAAPLLAVLNNPALRGKKIGLFACAGADTGGALRFAQEKLEASNEILGAIGFSIRDKSEHSDLVKKIQSWLGETFLI